jgi:hypothetical protein
MTGVEGPGKERRTRRRMRKDITAVCKLGNESYASRVHEISEAGMTILTRPNMPAANHYLVHCTLPNGVSATFETEERQRRELKRNGIHFLRIGVAITNESLDTLSFFKNLAEIELANNKKKGDARERKRMEFQLPVIADLEQGRFRCFTHDMGSWGLSVIAPSDFPSCISYRLTCIDPDGLDVPVVAEERNRTHLDNGKIRVGFRINEGRQGFRRFVEKYAAW